MKDTARDFISRMTGGNETVAELCARTVGGEDEGDVCLKLADSEEEELRGEPGVVTFADAETKPEAVKTPFVVYRQLLYTRRNWYYEWLVRDRLAALCNPTGLDDVDFPEGNTLRDEQKDAIRTMCGRQFSILTGGPGTGKTFTIANAVRIVREHEPTLRLGLAAPTGKAKARMMESMEQEKITDIPPATTIHMMLGSNPDLVTFRHNRAEPLPFDWVIIDEASMIDLPLMAKLLDAIPKGCRLTLAGDADQLASVERGRVFGDLCAMSWVPVSRLETSKRFPPGGPIAQLAAAVNGNRFEDAMAILRADGDVAFSDLVAAVPFHPEKWPGFAALVRARFAEFAGADSVDNALAHLNDFRVLCALRHGPFGSEWVAEWIRKALGKNCPVPMMITRNNETLGVRNGDVGVILPNDPQTLHLPAANGGRRTLRLELLPDTELAFASTVHKAQGSEFLDVAIVMPPAGENPLLTREILYTGITRTKGKVFLFAGEESVRRCCECGVERVTGLA